MDMQGLFGGRYHLERELGAGAMGAVYRAYDPLSGQYVALKRVLTDPEKLGLMFSVNQSGSYSVGVALANEFQLLASLHHPHVIRVLDYGFDHDKQPFFTMTLIDQPRTITDMGQGRSERVQVRLVVELLQALAYLHRRGVIHRDLKPDNALTDAQGAVKVLDFGLAVLHEDYEEDEEGRVFGTLPYMAPETLHGGEPSVQTDLYAAGVIAYEIFAGQHPFDLSSAAKLVNAILTQMPDIDQLDCAPGVTAVVARLLAKDPADRYHSAYDAIDDLAAAVSFPIPQETDSIRESYLESARFIGREAEMQQLMAALKNTATHRETGSTWLISGESGVGKSRLLDELGTQALVRGVIVLRGQGVPGGGLPYQLWREPLRRLALMVPPTDLEAGILKAIIPDIESLLGRQVPDAAEIEGDNQGRRLIGTVTSLFQRAAQPILLILEDLQWAEESLPLVNHINTQTTDLPLMIVGSYRDDERPDLPNTLPGMTPLSIKRLGADDVAQLSESMLGNVAKRADLQALLMRETEGNVYFLVEVVRALAEEAGQLNRIAQAELPEAVMAGGVTRILQRRLKRVPETARALLNFAALAGRLLDLDVLTRLGKGQDLDAWLDTCANCAVIEWRDDSWQFAHDKLRTTAVDGIGLGQRRALYAELAEAYERVHAVEPARAAVLADYWQQAERPDKELDYRRVAGDRALAVSALNEAARHFRRALALLPDGLQAGDDPEGRLHAELLVRLGEVLNYTADLAEAQVALESAQNIYQHAADEVGLAHTALHLAQTALLRGDYAAALNDAEDSLARSRRTNDARGQALALNRLARIKSMQGDFIQADVWGRESLDISRRIGDHISIARVSNNLGSVAQALGQFDAARRYLEETLTICRELGEQRSVGAALLNLGSVAGASGDLALARQRFEESRTIFSAIGERVGVAMALSNLGFVATLQHDYPQASAYLEESLTRNEAIGNRQGAANAMLNLGHVAKAQGQMVVAQDYYHRALERAHALQAVPLMLEALIGVAELHTDANAAARWVGLVLAHPAVTQETRAMAEALKAALTEDLDEAVLETLVQAGIALDLEQAVQAVIDT